MRESNPHFAKLLARTHLGLLQLSLSYVTAFLQTTIQGSEGRHLDVISSPRLNMGLLRGAEWGKFRRVRLFHSLQSFPMKLPRCGLVELPSLAFQLKSYEHQNKETYWCCVSYQCL